ncbi:hypothetical protein QQS21_012878 [Conoideocrella luteorostrata]|uniref:Uncharacterized protein n=1 Tax=Conoideocrella luteorostrata TaxID=1105319 RepID=A0AAJ0CAC1_9HYPO|nr:hypothetical protein QQS21_012878 [Conoideocrella luteorostrata]
MLDENLPTYRLQPSADNPLNTVLYFTHHGSEPSAEYLLKRPVLSESRNQYALGLLDVHYTSVIYAEVLVKPEWTQPSLSAAELRAQNGASTPVPLTPESFDILLYNPDQAIAVKRNHGSWGKSETWDFEIPERSFKLPSSSEIDKDSTPAISELAPKVVFHWKRDGRLSKDMTCYMSGRSVGGKKSKEPDITVAMYRAGKSDSVVTIYEPNMARVDVEDRKGLEVALILSAEVVRDLYLAPRQNPFNVTGGAAPSASKISRRTPSPPSQQQQQQQHQQQQQQNVPLATGALGLGIGSSPGSGANQTQVDVETKRLQAMVAEENRQAREREKRDLEEQKRIRKMLDQEEKERSRREAEVEKETERLRKQYGVQPSSSNEPPPQGYTSPALPPRPGQGHYASGGLGGGQPAMPPRPNSTGPSSGGRPSSANGGGKKKHSNPLGALLGPYNGASGASVSGFFHRSDEDKRKRVEKKRSF